MLMMKICICVKQGYLGLGFKIGKYKNYLLCLVFYYFWVINDLLEFGRC